MDCCLITSAAEHVDHPLMVRAFIMRFCWILSFRSLYFSRCAGVMRIRRSCSKVPQLRQSLHTEVSQILSIAPLAVPIDMHEQEQGQQAAPVAIYLCSHKTLSPLLSAHSTVAANAECALGGKLLQSPSFIAAALTQSFAVKASTCSMCSRPQAALPLLGPYCARLQIKCMMLLPPLSVYCTPAEGALGLADLVLVCLMTPSP